MGQRTPPMPFAYIPSTSRGKLGTTILERPTNQILELKSKLEVDFCEDFSLEAHR